jgi:peptidoglycan/LPS O-acetylase OafA/YrhL
MMGAWRLVLAWLVVADHTASLTGIAGTMGIGKIAVATFFFISGFLMPLTFDTHYRGYGTRTGSRKFYVNRFLRIYPIYWASLAVTLLAVLAYGPTLMEHATTLQDLTQVRTYLSNALLLGLNQTRAWGGDFRFNPPAWTLDVELQYYVLVPFILWMAAWKRRMTLALLTVIAGTSLYLFFRPVGLFDIDRSLLAWSFFFLLGYGFYLSPKLQLLALYKPLLAVVISLLLIVMWFSARLNLAHLSATFACIVVSAYLLVLQKNRGFGPLDRLLGDLSYPTYILHWICVQLIFRWVGAKLGFLGGIEEFVALLFLNVLASTLAAYASLRAIGYPIEALRRRIRDGKPSRRAPE